MPRWTRRGECNGCGYCCQYVGPVPFTVGRQSANDVAAWRLRGVTTVTEAGGSGLAHAFLPCREHDAAQQRCRIYAERPDICRAFPTDPQQIIGTPCSYWFAPEDA